MAERRRVHERCRSTWGPAPSSLGRRHKPRRGSTAHRVSISTATFAYRYVHLRVAVGAVVGVVGRALWWLAHEGCRRELR